MGGGNGGGGVARRAAVTAFVDGGRGAQCGLSSAEAEGRFKLCGEALEVLGDAAKRALYDQVRRPCHWSMVLWRSPMALCAARVRDAGEALRHKEKALKA